MKKRNHPLLTRVTAWLLSLVCVLGLLPTSAFAAGDTIKLERFGRSDVSYQSADLGSCRLHQMYFGDGSTTTIGFCGSKGKKMNIGFVGQTWNNKTTLSDPTVELMMAYYYSHSTGKFTDQARALGVDDLWDSSYTWYMNAWTQAVIWRYKEGTLGADPVVACAEELMAVYNSLEGTHYTSIDEVRNDASFRDRTQYIFNLGTEVWGTCTVYQYTYAGTMYAAEDVQLVILGDHDVGTTEDWYELTVKKVDASNPTLGLSGASFHVEAVNGSYSKDVVSGPDGTVTLENLSAMTYAITETAPPPGGYGIDNVGPYYVVLPNGNSNEVTVTFSDTPEITGAGSIRKVDADNPNRGIAGAVVKIDGVDNNFTGTYTSGPNGYFTDIPWTTMPVGSYTAEEVTPPGGYSLSSDPAKVKQSFYWDGHSDVSLVFENDALVKLQLTKLDDSGNPLQGVIFNVLTLWLGPGDNETLIFTNKKKPYLTIIKTEKGSNPANPIAGTAFLVEAIDGDYQSVWTTGADGSVSGYLEAGSFKITEQSVPEPFFIPDKDADRVQVISLSPGDEKTVAFEDSRYPELTIRKLDSITGSPVEGAKFHITYTTNGEAVEGAVFEVKYLGGTSGTGGTVIGQFTTWSNGAFVLTGLKAGTYVVQELSAPSSHVIDSAPQTAYISGADQDVVQLYFGNSPKGSVLISKIDADTHAPLSDVEFFITDSNGTVIGNANGKYVTDSAGNVIGNANGKYVTDSAGTILIDGLTPDMTVIAKEVRTLSTHILDDTPQTIKIKANETVQLEFRNHAKGTLVILKKDAVTGAPLEGVEFLIRYADGGYLPDAGGTLSSNGVYFSDSSGKILITGVVGTVVVSETRTIPGYTIHEETRTQTVVVNSNDTQTLYFYNDPVGGVELIKVSESDRSKRIPNTTFEIRRIDGGLVTTVTTDSSGRVYAALDAGDYYCVETVAGTGFQLDSTPHYFTV